MKRIQPKFDVVHHWRLYTKNSSLHGVKYVSDDSLSSPQRLFWFLNVVLALTVSIFICFRLSDEFQRSPLATVIDSTTFPVAEIPFPAVTICNRHHLDYTKLAMARKRFIPAASTKTGLVFDEIMRVINPLEFGSFDTFEVVRNKSFIGLEHVDFTAVADYMTHKCEDFLKNCFWRNKSVKCCDIFSRQKSEFGICYSFNSLSSVGTSEVNRSHLWPWRTASSGPRAGLMVTADTLLSKKFPKSNDALGVLVLIQHAEEWPNEEHFIPAATESSIIITPVAYHTSRDLKQLSMHDRNCVYEHDVAEKKLMKLKSLPYTMRNCVSECKQQHMLKYCGCVADLLYPSGIYPACNISGLICLCQNDVIFNNMKPMSMNPFFNASEEGLNCDCLPKCNVVRYNLNFQSNNLKKGDNIIRMDIFYGSTMMERFRTDVTFGWMDLMVSFGGIVSLFLGCSMLSIVELVYFMTIGLCCQQKKAEKVQQIRQDLFAHRTNNVKKIKKIGF